MHLYMICFSWGLSSKMEQTVRKYVCHHSWRRAQDLGHQGKSLYEQYLHVKSSVYEMPFLKFLLNLYVQVFNAFFLHFSVQEGTSPVQYIAAHLSKIHGLDWNPNSKSELATCSQDCSVKVNHYDTYWYIYTGRDKGHMDNLIGIAVSYIFSSRCLSFK